MAVIWRETMSVGNADIDKDHRYLLCLINTVELALQSPDQADIITGALEELEKYTKDHFTREEEIQKKIGFPQSYEHLKKHRELTIQFQNIKQRVLTSLEKTKKIGDAQEVVVFLRKWLIDHVIQEDLQMKPYLQKHS